MYYYYVIEIPEDTNILGLEINKRSSELVEA